MIVHDSKGGLEIYGYPRELFPPTDFHSATLVNGWIYLIGSLGYGTERGHETPVFRLNTETWSIERIATVGESPGWIHAHEARYENGRISISGGKVFNRNTGGASVENTKEHALDLETFEWSEL